jgi:methylase of polypeptide subunit release factors
MPLSTPPSRDPQSLILQKLHELLESSGYGDAGIAPTITEEPMPLPDASAAPSKLNTLLRLFFMFEECPADDVAAALHPLTADELMAVGILRPEGDLVSACVRIQPFQHLLFLFEQDAPDTAPEESLMLISPSSMEVAHLMTRRRSRKALDIGTGCGFLATLVAPFCEKVYAIDVNPAAVRAAEFNARWNGLPNISFEAGNLLEPVRGQRFDLIVCNPPFLITPVPEVFSARFLFKHSGLAGDTFCINLAREASQLLEEGGYFHMMFQWEEPQGANWSSQLEKSFSGLGCDVWVSRISTAAVEQYVTEWIEGLSESEQACSELLTEQALRYFREKNVATTSTGLLTLRRATDRKNYSWFDEAPEDRGEPYGATVAALFDTRVYLAGLSDAALLQEQIRVSPDVTMLQTSRLESGEWLPTATELALTHGLKYSFGDVDPELIKLLAHLDGERTLHHAFHTFAQKNSAVLPTIAAAHLPQIRELLSYGFLLPGKLGLK